jgi:hypothetical protein
VADGFVVGVVMGVVVVGDVVGEVTSAPVCTEPRDTRTCRIRQ